MTLKKVFVTGAAGQTGTQTLKWLQEVGENLDVYAGIHKGQESKQETVVKSFKCCPCVTEGADHKRLVDCFRDVQDLFVIPPATEDKVEVASNYIKAAKEAGVKFVLLLSVQGADIESYSWGSQFKEIEKCLQESGLESWCIVRTPFYMQNILLYKEQIKQGLLPLPSGDGKFTAIDVADVGKSASWILKDCASHKGKTYHWTGAESMNGTQLSAVLSKALNEEVAFKDASPEEARSILKRANIPDVEVKGLLDFYELASKNTFDKVTDDFKLVCNSPPKSFYDWAREHKSEFA